MSTSGPSFRFATEGKGTVRSYFAAGYFFNFHLLLLLRIHILFIDLVSLRPLKKHVFSPSLHTLIVSAYPNTSEAILQQTLLKSDWFSSSYQLKNVCKMNSYCLPNNPPFAKTHVSFMFCPIALTCISLFVYMFFLNFEFSSTQLDHDINFQNLIPYKQAKCGKDWNTCTCKLKQM